MSNNMLNFMLKQHYKQQVIQQTSMILTWKLNKVTL